MLILSSLIIAYLVVEKDSNDIDLDTKPSDAVSDWCTENVRHGVPKLCDRLSRPHPTDKIVIPAFSQLQNGNKWQIHTPYHCTTTVLSGFLKLFHIPTFDIFFFFLLLIPLLLPSLLLCLLFTTRHGYNCL